MCLAFWVLGCPEPGPRLLLAFNRDEYFARPTRPLQQWTDGSGIIAGQDMECLGTWLGATAGGRLAFLTNLRDTDPVEPASTHAVHTFASRGELITRFLNGTATPQEFVRSLNLELYHGFNLVVGDLRTLSFAYINNGPAPGARKPAAAAAEAGAGTGAGSGAVDGTSEGQAAAAQAAGGAASARPAAACSSTAVGEQQAAGGACGKGEGRGEEEELVLGLVSGDEEEAEGCEDEAPLQVLHAGTVYGLSNGRLMEWPKVHTGVELLQHQLLPCITRDSMPWDRVFGELLGDRTKHVPPPANLHAVLQQLQQQRQQQQQPQQQPQQPQQQQPQQQQGEERIPAGGCSAAQGAGAPCAISDGHTEAAAAGGSPPAGAHDGTCSGSGDCRGAAGVSSAGAAAAPQAPLPQPDTPTHAAAHAHARVPGAVLQDPSGFAAVLEHITSGRFVEQVKSPYGMYGTRSQTVLVVWHDGSAEARERHRGEDEAWHEQRVEFRVAL